MTTPVFTSLFESIVRHGYLIMFVLMFIEGPLVTAAAAFAAALGYFNVFIVLVLSLLGDISADLVYYLVGYYAGQKLLKNILRFFGVSQKRVEKIEHLIKHHSLKTLALIKFTPLLPLPGLIVVGSTGYPIIKFNWIIFLITLPRTIIFILLGYFFGRAFTTNSVLKHSEISFFAVAIIIISISIIYNQITSRYAKKDAEL